MVSERAQQANAQPTKQWTAGRAVARRAIALVSMLAIAVPVLVTTLATPAGATTTFDVPALVSDSAIGYATGLTVTNSVTLTANGAWSESPACNLCRDANGIPPLAGENQANWLLPNGRAFVLAGRIGTSGPWTAVGSGPVTLVGNGSLYMAMNDRLPSYADNSGSMHVSVADPLQLSTQYFAEGPVLAGTAVDWEGTVQNNNDTTVGGVHASVSLGAPAAGVPTWTVPSTESSGNCTLSEGADDLYFCDLGDLPAGASAFVDATVDTQGIRPQTLADSFSVSSDQSSAYNADAAVAHQRVDGLRIDVLQPDSIPEGNVLSLTGTITNTSATETISGIVVHAAIDNGTIHSGPPGCTVDNGSPPGGTIDCPSSGTFSLPPGGSVDGTTTVNTDGLAEHDIGWSVVANTPDLGGDTYTASGSVPVVFADGAAPPSISIVSPANNQNLGQTLSYNFHANTTPATDLAIDFVDLQVDFEPRTIISAPPYETTIAPGTLSPGSHVLKATAHQNDGQTAFASVTVNVVAPPTVAIVPPPGFTQLDTAKTFKSNAAPGAGAPGVTVNSVDYAIDGSGIGTTVSPPYTKVVDPASPDLFLSAGPHTLTATAIDSTGQSATNDFVFTVPQATLQVASTIPPIGDQITANGDAAWPVQVTNTSGAVAHHAQLTFDVTATDQTSNTMALSFDLGAINGGLNRPATTQSCVQDDGPTFHCALPDIPANSSLPPFRVFVTTGGVTVGSTITGTVVASAANADDATGTLGTVNVITCGSSCVIGVAAPGDPFASTPGAPTPANPTKQVITLSSGTPGGPQLPAITVTLSSINPNAATDPGDEAMCPTGAGETHCSGQISSVVAQFGDFVNKKNPIRVTIITRWGGSIPPGYILMEKSTGGDPIFLVPCEVDPATREFNTPCVLPEVVHGSSAAGNLTTYDSILFVGDDVHFARRTSDGGTVINPPAAPTGVNATPGVGKATVRWVAPTVTNGAAVSGYVVTALSGGVVQKTVPFASAALTQVITGLTAGKTYTFKVAAKNVAGAGPASVVSNAIKPISPPAAPTGVTATAGAAKATLRWTAPTVTNGSPVNGYVVTVLISGVVQKTVAFASTALTQVITGLTAGKTYTFKVAAKNIAGTGTASALSNAVKPT